MVNHFEPLGRVVVDGKMAMYSWLMSRCAQIRDFEFRRAGAVRKGETAGTGCIEIRDYASANLHRCADAVTTLVARCASKSETELNEKLVSDFGTEISS